MSNMLHVTNVPTTAHEADLRQLFAKFGMVRSARLIPCTPPDSAVTTGLIEMETEQQGAAAVAAVDGVQLGDRILAVEWASTRHVTDADQSSLFLPMNMTADEPNAAGQVITPSVPARFITHDRPETPPRTVWNLHVVPQSEMGNWGPFTPSTSDRAGHGVVSEGIPLDEEVEPSSKPLRGLDR
jgi:RNA recognition motif-containing protein